MYIDENNNYIHHRISDDSAVNDQDFTSTYDDALSDLSPSYDTNLVPLNQFSFNSFIAQKSSSSHPFSSFSSPLSSPKLPQKSSKSVPTSPKPLQTVFPLPFNIRNGNNLTGNEIRIHDRISDRINERINERMHFKEHVIGKVKNSRGNLSKSINQKTIILRNNGVSKNNIGNSIIKNNLSKMNVSRNSDVTKIPYHKNSTIPRNNNNKKQPNNKTTTTPKSPNFTRNTAPKVPPTPSLPPMLPPCRVCGEKASGFHYGANTCEACKVCGVKWLVFWWFSECFYVI